MRILVADDDIVISHLISSTLRGRGHEPVAAYDARQVLTCAMREPRPQVILLDINMPGSAGLELLTTLKQSAGTSAIPVIVLSGSSDAAVPDTVRELGAAEYLSKPVDRSALLAALERVTQG
jgi:CheY-like chemotaxis protein